MRKIKYAMLMLLIFIGVQLSTAQTGQPAELLLVSQPTMSYHGDYVRLYYDVQNIGSKRYKGKVYIYLDPDNGYYYAAKKVRVCKGRIKRVKIDVPVTNLMSDSVYTVMPYYSVGSQLHSFTIFEDFGLLSFCVNRPAKTNYSVSVAPKKVTTYTYVPSATRYYYDGYVRSQQVNSYYSMPYHHTYQYHHQPNHSYYGPRYVTPQGNPMVYPYNNPPKPNNSWNHTMPPKPITGYNPPQPNPAPHNNYNQQGGNNNPNNTTLDPNNQAHVRQGTAGSMSSNNANNNQGNNNNPGNNNQSNNNQGGGNNANVNNHNANQYNNQNQGGTGGRAGTTSRNDSSSTNVNNSANTNNSSTSGASGRAGATTSGRNNTTTTGSSDNNSTSGGATGRAGTTTTQRAGNSDGQNAATTTGSSSSRDGRSTSTTTQRETGTSSGNNTGAATRGNNARTNSSTRGN